MKFLQDHLLSKRRAQNKPSIKKQPPTHDSNKDKTIVSELALHQQDRSEWNLDDEEYDPMQPNSYEAVKAEYLKSEKRRLAELANSSTKKLNLPHLLDVIDKLDGDDDISDSKRIKGTAIAPPLSLSGSTNSMNHVCDRQETDVKPRVLGNDLSAARMNASSIAAKIMSKMGYKQGQGLGKDEQGISQPLEVEKSGPNLGKISLPPVMQPATPADKTDSDQETKPSTATRVLLLQNMVGPGEVDEELESETKEECTKYGQVEKCLIYEIPNKRVPDEEAVRIFVEFRHVESTIKAANDLNGRYFGGRIVRASFYSVEKFNKYELSL